MVEEVESMCMRCHENGITRLLLTYIPYFKQVIVASFQCDHCGERNNEIQSAGEIQGQLQEQLLCYAPSLTVPFDSLTEKGVIYTVHITTPHDLNRQLVKSSFATLSIPELQLEIPPKIGQLTTIEGIISDTLRDLEIDQPVRKHVDPPTYEKLDALCKRLKEIIGETEELVPQDAETSAKAAGAASTSGLVSHGAVGAPTGAPSSDENRTFPPFTLRLDDPSGNSFIEFLGDISGRGANDAKWTKRDYPRQRSQNVLLGLAAPEEGDGDAAMETSGDGSSATATATGAQPTLVAGFSKDKGETDFDNEEIYSFPGTCSSCTAPLNTLMKKVNIPYFKDILIMSTNCDRCGYRDNEVKSGGAISDTGRKLTLSVQDSEDLSRDLLKSETAGLEIPEIDLHLTAGTLGGRFTTLEGLLQQIYDELSSKVMASGDSAASGDRNAFETFLGKLKSVMACDTPFTVIVDDPLSNSYIQNPYAPDPDEQLVIENYTRSFDQNEELGLNDIKVDGYQDEHEAQTAAAAAAGITRKADEITTAPSGKEVETGAEAIKKPRVEDPNGTQ